MAVASERAPLMTVFNKKMEEVSELDPGSILVIRSNGEVIKVCRRPCKNSMYLKIYFSRGMKDIYAEKKLGALLVPQVLEVVGKDFSESV